MPDEPSYILDIRSLSDGGEPSGQPPEASSGTDAQGRRWIGLQFDCCGVYTRIYRNRDGTAYTGACPRCGRPVQIRIGQGGTNSRMFRAT